MWISEKEIYCHVLNAERCANEPDMKKQNVYGGMATVFFVHAMFTVADQECGAMSIKQRL